jgi:predicted DCC family thiol-disulfide oxidoreductase YuxK
MRSESSLRQNPVVPDLVLYDGSCGLCHRSVAFLARRDRDGSRFRFAPLGGEAASVRFRASAPAGPFGPGASVVLLTADGRLFLRSDAVLHALGRLGGAWRVLARFLAIVPRPLRDGAYSLVARIRGKLFARPEGTCPRLPPDLAGRFLL